MGKEKAIHWMTGESTHISKGTLYQVQCNRWIEDRSKITRTPAKVTCKDCRRLWR